MSLSLVRSTAAAAIRAGRAANGQHVDGAHDHVEPPELAIDSVPSKTMLFRLIAPHRNSSNEADAMAKTINLFILI
jgi:hypothetical protein